jgi:hypothetical protein
MERLTESNYRSLAEAYSTVYSEDDRTELTEDQQIQEFLEVINSLVEEGYDLSEYTYDELYECYVTEGLGGRVASAAKDVLVKTAKKYGPRALETVKKGAKEVGKIPVQGTKNIVKGVIKPLQTKAGSVAATLAGLEAVLAGEKSITRKALGKAGEGIQSLGRAVYGDNGSQKPKQEKPKGSGNPLGLNQDVDLFDLIKGHLLDEGYADNEEAALKIMANMSEEWKQSVVEGLSPLGTKTAGVVDDQRRGSTRDKDLKDTEDSLKKMRPYPNGFPGVKGV